MQLLKYKRLSSEEKRAYAILCETRTFEETTTMIKNILDARYDLFMTDLIE